MRPENLVNAISQKPMEGILRNIGDRCIWVGKCTD